MDDFRVTRDEAPTPDHTCLDSWNLHDWAAVDPTSLARRFPTFVAADSSLTACLVRQPNATDGDPASVAAAANAGLRPLAVPRMFGSLVSAGCIMTVHNAGQAQVLPPGRYWWTGLGCNCFPQMQWGRAHSLRSDHIREGSLSIVRVPRGCVGLATENQMPVLLGEGIHVYNTPLFRFKELKNVDEPHIQYMSLHIIRVPKGHVVKAVDNYIPKLLTEGLHVVDSNLFQLDGCVSLKVQHIAHGPISVLQVPSGFVGLVKRGGAPLLLHEGVYVYDSPTLSHDGVRNKTDALLQHGTITRFRVTRGEIALAWRGGSPTLVDKPGTYQIDSPTFKFEKVVRASEKTIALGARKIITVYDGEVGISYKGGVLDILQPGRHQIWDAAHVFDDFMDLQQRTLRLCKPLPSSRNLQEDFDGEMLECDTSDLVKVNVTADAFYRVVDPRKVIESVGLKKVPDLIRDCGIAGLLNIIRSTPLHMVSQGSDHEDMMRECFLSRLRHDFDSLGIEVSDLRVVTVTVADPALSTAMQKGVLNTTQTEVQLSMLAGQTRVAVQEQQTNAMGRRLMAASAASAVQIKIEAELEQAEVNAKELMVRAHAYAAQLKAKCEGESDAIRTRAEAQLAQTEAEARGLVIAARASLDVAHAEANSIRAISAAEVRRATVLADTDLGGRLALLDLYADVVIACQKGVRKTLHVRKSGLYTGDPMGGTMMDSLGDDLAALTALGTAAVVPKHPARALREVKPAVKIALVVPKTEPSPAPLAEKALSPSFTATSLKPASDSASRASEPVPAAQDLAPVRGKAFPGPAAVTEPRPAEGEAQAAPPKAPPEAAAKGSAKAQPKTTSAGGAQPKKGQPKKKGKS